MRPHRAPSLLLAPLGIALAAPVVLSSASFVLPSLNAGLHAFASPLLLAQGLICAALLAVYAKRRTAHQGRQARLLEEAGLGSARWQRDRFGNLGSSEVSPTWLQMTGQQGGRRMQATDWLDIAVHPMDKDRVAASIQALFLPDGADSCNETLRLHAPSGQDWRWYELRTRVQQRNRRGQPLLLASTLVDVTGQYTAAERQRISVGLFQHLQEGVLVTDLQFRVLDANPAYCRMIGLSRESLLGRIAAPLLPEALQQAGHETGLLQRTLDAGESWQGRGQVERGDGSLCIWQLAITTIPEPDGPLRYRVVTASDLTQTLRQQQQLEQLSRFDTLTGLPNHDEFMRLLQVALDASEREGLRLAVCRVDIDHFKRINIQHGDAIADALLVQAAQRLESALRSGPQWADAVGRLDGDEFALLLRTADTEEAQRALSRLLNVLRAPYRIGPDGQELVLEITASVGATLYPQDNSDAETLLRHAGHTLYRMKHTGRNGYRFFDSAKRLRDEASLIELARMQQALDESELLLHYQPKIDMQSGRVLGMEALLRWQHPERGLLPPAQFLPMIEQTGLAVQVGDWVIDHALKQIALWLEQGLALNISVNVTARQLQMPDFSQRLQELINRHHRPVARYLSLEVLESAALADIQATHEVILRCRAFGVRFALDDFGTGYSTLTYLKKLPVDTLKIDRSFVQNMLTDAQDMALVEGVIGLARHFGCEVIAEGVESAAHARALLRLGCQQGQGNGISPALPAEDIPAWVHSFARSPWLMQLGNSGLRAQG